MKHTKKELEKTVEIWSEYADSYWPEFNFVEFIEFKLKGADGIKEHLEEKQIEKMHEEHEKEEKASYRNGIYFGIVLGVASMLIVRYFFG